MKAISNQDLTIEDVPLPDSAFDEIARFAYTFGGYEQVGSFEQCAEIANQRKHDTLTQLRACLFFEQRRARHTGQDADDNEVEYQRELVRLIRTKVALGQRA
jgi:hypothetical protein